MLEGTLYYAFNHPHGTEGRWHYSLGPRLTREASPTPENGGRRHMETSTHSKPPKAKTRAKYVNLMILLPFLMLLVCKTLGESPHAPKQLTWQVLSQAGEVIWSIIGLHPPGTWWPTLLPNFCQLAVGTDTWDIPNYLASELQVDTGKRTSPGGGFGCGSPEVRCHLEKLEFYICPRDG